jgi:uncharacterized protein
MRKRLRAMYEKFISLKGEPKNIALGFAIGLFIGFCPIFGVHTFLLIGIVGLFRVHFSAAFVASWIAGNPFSLPFVIAGEYYIGSSLLGVPNRPLPTDGWTLESVMSFGWELTAMMVVGGILLALPFALVSYPIVRIWMTRLQKGEKPSI